jgi:uncharacterized membrane protein
MLRTPGVCLPRIAVLLWSAAMLTVIFAAPLVRSAGHPEAWLLYRAFEPFCHQHAERSWHIHGWPLAVCVRCFGVYGGLALAGLAGWRLPARVMVFSLVLMAFSWAVEFAGIAVADAIRFATGLMLGFSAGGAVLSRAGLSSRRTLQGPVG